MAGAFIVGCVECVDLRGFAWIARRRRQVREAPMHMVSWTRTSRLDCGNAARNTTMPSRHPAYTISALAKEFALTTRAIRFYEDEGLIAPQRVGRVRVYGERERVRLKLILRGKRLGLALSEIGELLDMYEVSRNERGQLAKFVELLADRRARLMQQKEDIDATLAEIDGIERECRRQLKQAADTRGAAAAAASRSGRAGAGNPS
jgi:DNA-binding transcriptional MerR regulator